MRVVVKFILNQKETDRVLRVRNINAKSIIGFQLESKYQCKNCKHRTPLRSGTLLHVTQLPYYYWYFAMMMLTSTKKSYSALEIQRQLSHRYYEPIWYMLHEIRYAMGKRDDKYTLFNELEYDEVFLK